MSEAAFAMWFMVIGTTTVIVVSTWLIYWLYRMKLLEREERRLMVERGMTPPAPQPLGWAAVRARELQLQFEERRLSIEKGVPIPPETTHKDEWIRCPETTQNWFLFFGVISPGVALYGAANILHYWMTRNSNVSNVSND